MGERIARETETMTTPMLPADRWNLTHVATVEVDDETYAVYSDEQHTWAMPAEGWDTPTTRTDYSDWCSSMEGRGIGDPHLCARIAAAADLQGIYSAGACMWVDAAQG